MEFFILNLIYLASFLACTLLVIFKSKYRNHKFIKYYLNSILLLIFAIVFYKGHTNQKELDKYGIETVGRVVEKHRAKVGFRIKSEFLFKKKKYDAELNINLKKEYEKIKIGDSMKIKFLSDFPQNNKGIKIIKTSIP